MKYVYTSYWNDAAGTTIDKPYLDIELINGKQKIYLKSIVDSGSDFTLVSEEVAKVLNINLSLCPKKSLGGILGNSIECPVCNVDIKIDGFKGKINIPIFFVPNLKVNTLMGQHGFFDKFKVIFSKNDKKFELIKFNK